jgi:alanine racemase
LEENMKNRPCWVETDTRALAENYRFLSALAAPHAELLAIVKADAYGHGLALCAPAAVLGGARWLGVTTVEEGVEARAVCPEAEILVISGAFPGQGEAVVRHRLTPVVWEPWQLDELESAVKAAAGAAPVKVHLEIDTGMSRQGVRPEDVAAILPRIRSSAGLRLDGVMTHLFAADEADGRITEDQMQALERALEAVGSAGVYPAWLNVGSSAALVAGRAQEIGALAERHGMKAMMRPGLALYGLIPEFAPAFENAEPASLKAARASLKPVLSWKTRVASVRSIEAGSLVGYNGTFTASEPMQLALVAVGYADGLRRRLSNGFPVLIHGQRAPIVGRISMDQTMIDVTGIEDVRPGDEVVLVGSQGSECLAAEEMAHALGTISWEIFTSIGQRVERKAR